MVPNYKPTPQMVVALWAHFEKKYDLTVVKKNKSCLMRLVAWFLSTFDILERARFMKNFATTIGTFIYIPFNVGEYLPRWPLQSQIAIIVHELKHTLQYRETSKGRIGDLLFFWRYLRYATRRANFEIEAYALNMELYHWATGKFLDPEALANKLYAYDCDDPEVITAKERYEEVNAALKTGNYVYRCLVQETIDWLDNDGQRYLEIPS